MSAWANSGLVQRSKNKRYSIRLPYFFWMHLSSAISRKARLRIIRTSYIIRMTTPQSAERGHLLMDESDKSALQLLAKLAQQLASLQGECCELRRELDYATKVQQEQLEQLAALKARYDQLCRERDAFRKALEEQLTLNPAFCVMPDPNTEH